jgi:protein-L-isoaspartate(D-aspartate) O-methyltransferase
LLAKKGKFVHSIEIVPELAAMAEKNLRAHAIGNVMLETGDAARGWSQHGPYDVIALTGSVPVLPAALQESLATGGRLFAIVGEPPVMNAVLVTRVTPPEEPGEFSTIGLFETCIPPLKNAQRPTRFVF